ncbi:MAG: protein kinase [Gemmatimonadaceae bacterium]
MAERVNRCPACGTIYADDAVFCPRDGMRLVAPPSRRGSAARGRAEDVDHPGDREAEGAGGGAGVPPAGSTPLEPPGLIGTVLDGRYRVEIKVGEGGMSFVYLARDVTTGERYAIKLLSASLAQDAKAMARLRREATFGMRLIHPNICHIIRLGETADGLVYVVMPYVEGELLSDRTGRAGQLPLALTVSLVRDIAAGLQVAHEQGIVHRDLKPENVMVCRRADGSEYAVVMDFGLAKERRAGAELQKLTGTGIILGTPEFMSPEQLRGRQLDGRTDVYSLALITCEMLTGKLPFLGATQQEIMMARLRGGPVPMRELRPDLDLPDGVQAVIDKALHRSPDDRFATAPEFAAALAAAQSAVPRRPEGLLARLFRR